MLYDVNASLHSDFGIYHMHNWITHLNVYSSKQYIILFIRNIYTLITFSSKSNYV